MKRVNVGKLKAGLSHYLRQVQRGETVLVLDRKRPVAELVSLKTNETTWERLEREGRCRVGSLSWEGFLAPKLKRPVAIERILKDVSADSE